MSKPLVAQFFNGIAALLFTLAVIAGLWAGYQFKLALDMSDWNKQECQRLIAEKADPSKAKHKSGEQGSEEFYTKSNIIHPCKISDYQIYFNSKMTAQLSGLLLAAGIFVLLLKKFLFALKKIMTWLFD